MFQSSIRRDEFDSRIIHTFLKWTGDAQHFVPGSNRWPGSLQFCFAMPKDKMMPVGLPIVQLAAEFRDKYSCVIDPMGISKNTANPGKEFYSINFKIEEDIPDFKAVPGEEFMFFTISFSEGEDDMTGLQLANFTNYMENPQAQFSIQGNQKDPATIDPRDPKNSGSAYEYTNPFENPSKLFYVAPNEKAALGQAGEGHPNPELIMEVLSSTYESWVELLPL